MVCQRLQHSVVLKALQNLFYVFHQGANTLYRFARDAVPDASNSFAQLCILTADLRPSAYTLWQPCNELPQSRHCHRLPSAVTATSWRFRVQLIIRTLAEAKKVSAAVTWALIMNGRRPRPSALERA